MEHQGHIPQRESVVVGQGWDKEMVVVALAV